MADKRMFRNRLSMIYECQTEDVFSREILKGPIDPWPIHAWAIKQRIAFLEATFTRTLKPPESDRTSNHIPKLVEYLPYLKAQT
ncbi:MAG: hypothetical protein ACRBB0_14810 [Pelagimonas sp.]|uniref:hypothetical protein n=1 Tax=Pelagimonas sp. TaxID=2073170 RepID=UPI003D6BFDC1